MPGDTSFVIIASANAKTSSKRLKYNYTPAPSPQPVTNLSIESVQTFPEGNLVLKQGDKIRFRVKALPGSFVKIINNQPLFEMPVSQTNGMPGIYQGEYLVKETTFF